MNDPFVLFFIFFNIFAVISLLGVGEKKCLN